MVFDKGLNDEDEEASGSLFSIIDDSLKPGMRLTSMFDSLE